MASYDYKSGKERVDAILNNKLEVIEKKIPSDSSFTFENGYYGWVTGIFVDIRDSSILFADENRIKVAKIVRSFTSEIIEILRDDDNLREIGIRGDCVYAIFATPNQSDIYELADKTFYINTYLNLLNKLLQKKSYPTIKAGIGMSSAQELVVKAGRKDVGINNKVWIGSAVTKASNLSSLGSKNGISPLVYSSVSYSNFIDTLVEKNGEKAESWFTQGHDYQNGTYD
jgi:hypothetical protein